MIDLSRVQKLNSVTNSSGTYVLYWMQCSQRAEHNPALDFAIMRGNDLGLPIVCLFVMDPAYPEANTRHFTFMLQGLEETAVRLNNRGVKFVYRVQSVSDGVLHIASTAKELICDRGYARNHVATRMHIAEKVRCAFYQVEGDVVVPIDEAYPKEAWSAAVLRPKIARLMDGYLRGHDQPSPIIDSVGTAVDADPFTSADDLLSRLSFDEDLSPVSSCGGLSHATELWTSFLDNKLPSYGSGRNSPSDEIYSGMSPYLHFGQISPIALTIDVRSSPSAPSESKDAFIEELIIRRELAMNYVRYNPYYDSYDALPQWAKTTLADHAKDKRPVVYDLSELESGKTHDQYWNAAMYEMRHDGFMHNYMRMYWGKKIIEWTENPRDAFAWMLYLNNRYFLDGRDPNSYAGVAWCFGKHDRAWKERPVFGKVRYMNAAGLERKFDMSGYLEKHAPD